MNDQENHILVFKTNISNEADKNRLGKTFSQLSHITDWHIDTEDVDKVLRIVSKHPDPWPIIRSLNSIGYECRELE
jgi:hypothetical protein